MSAPIRLLLLAGLLFAGCGDKAPAPTGDEPAAEKKADEQHAEQGAEKKADGHHAEKKSDGHHAEKKADGDHAEKKAAGHAAHAAAGGLTLKLDDGKKWKMDDHTRAALGTIEARLAKGPATDDIAGYKALGAELDGEIQNLVRGCTMTGPAHDQLHVWLTRFIPAVGALGEAADLGAAKGKRVEITTLVAAARQHFE